MKIFDYEKLINRIDSKLKKGTFMFKYKEYREEKNIFTGTRYIGHWKETQAVKRNDHMVIDNKGVWHSLIKDELQFS